MAKQTQDRGTGELVAVTANRLADGVVVWLTATDGWSERVELAAAFDAAGAPGALEVAREHERRRVVVEPYTTEVVLNEGVPEPKRLREKIRAAGPTVRLDLGNQSLPPPVLPTPAPAAFGSFYAGE